MADLRPLFEDTEQPANMFRFVTMNRFRNRKKTDEGMTVNTDALNQLSTPPPVSPGLKKSATSRWKKSKKQPEPKPEIDLTAALPSTDEFRTSLLMANLSQRFSMLREQDDPSSLVGKASDDSVLQPSRRSRMLDFGFSHGGLNDIAEVQSINSSIRPPFARQKHDSFASEDGYGSENEAGNASSMMSRARPGEGNVLFGGRQKVYMIPKSGANSTRSLGKAVYEDDIGKSAFQKHRQRERELQEARELEMPEDPETFDFGLDQASGGDELESATVTPDESGRDLSNSPSLSSYDKKRSTTSTARSEARSSTAATSIASQPLANASAQTPTPLPAAAVTTSTNAPPPLERSNTKTRRLYEQGLDQHMQEQQTSALSRLNSIQRQRVPGSGKGSPPVLQTAKSAGNLQERPARNVYDFRAQSPPPVAPLKNFGSLRRPGGSPLTSVPNSPLSPPLSDVEENNALSQALEPGDRGKATAMGAFNKPAQAFDEQQYMERQKQLQRSNSSAALSRQPSRSAFQQRIGRFEQAERDRSASNPTSRSRSRSQSKQSEPSKAFNVFQNAASRNQSLAGAQQPSQAPAQQPSQPVAPPPQASQPTESPATEKPAYPDTHRTFFGNISASDSEDETDEPYRHETPYGQQDYGYNQQYGRWQPSVLPSVSEHPALRSERSGASIVEEEEEEDEVAPLPVQPQMSHTAPREDTVLPAAIAEEEVDSPTLGPSREGGLGHMMHHLRSKSTASSMYPHDDASAAGDDVPGLPAAAIDPGHQDTVHQPVRSTYGSESRIDSTYTNSNPWDLDEVDHYYANEETSRSSVSPIEAGRANIPYASSRAPSRAAQLTDRQSELWQEQEQPTWQQELGKQHARNASTATQQERAAFDNELAARRNAIQESIKSMVETDSVRNVSPAPSGGGAFKAFNMLRSKSSRDSMDPRKEAPSKAMKMLGIGGSSTPAASSTNLNSQYERGGMSLDMARSRGNSASRPYMPSRVLQQSEEDARRERERSRARGESDASNTQRPVGRSPASSEAGRGRGRSNSEATTGRSRSRTGPYRDDLEKAMIEGTGSSAAGVPDLSPMMARELTPRHSPDAVQQPFEAQNRTRSNSRAGGMTNYFDPKNMQPIQTGQHARMQPNGASPAQLTPSSFQSMNGSARNSPAVPSFSHMATPPLSGANTPVNSKFTPPPMPPGPTLRSVGPLRKKTISKSEISEPIALLSSTSNVDTIDLPAGASLKNGMDSPPPVPPVNPRRRGTRKLFGLGRSESDDHADVARSKTPDPWMNRPQEHNRPAEMARSNTVAPGARQRNVSSPQKPFESSPALNQYGFEANGLQQSGFEQSPAYAQHPATRPYGYEQHALSSPERIDRSQTPQQPMPMEGGFI